MNELATPVSGCQIQAPEEHKPLMVMFPWLGFRPQALTKYCEIYFNTGFDVLVIESEAKQFLWPRWGLDHGKRILDLLHSERFVSRPLLIHAFSIGGYTFAQLLVTVSQDTQKYQALTQRIKGQVFDSLVVGSVNRMATGLGKMLVPRLESLVKRASLLYFGLFKHQTIDYFNAGIEVFYNTPVTAPALFYFCENDILSDPQAVDDVIAYLRKRGMKRYSKKMGEFATCWSPEDAPTGVSDHPQHVFYTRSTLPH